MKDDVISRRAAATIPVMPKEHRHYQTNNLDDAYEQGWNDLQECIENLPPVQPKHGKWIERESGTEDKENGFETVIVCSCCDFPATTFYSEDCESRTQIRTDFCPNCGADMRGKSDADNY